MSHLDALTIAGTSPICQYHSGLLAYGRSHSESRETARHIRNGARKTTAIFENAVNFSVSEPRQGQLSSTEPTKIGNRQLSQLDLNDSARSVSTENRASNSVSAKAHLLSIAGMFDSGKSDGSEILKKVVAEALEKKYGGKTDGKPD